MDKTYEKDLLTSAGLAQDYLAHVLDMPVFPSARARAGLSAFDEALPECGKDSTETLELLHRVGGPATTATTGARYFGFVVGGTLPAAAAANWLATAWDQSPSSEMNSPAAVKVETVANRWLLEILGLPASSGVGMTTGATMANFTGLAAARTALLSRKGWDVEVQGLYGAPEIKVVVSEEVHITVEKALSMLGFGKGRVTRVRTDANGAMLLDHVPSLDDMTIVCTQAGNVNSGAIDPIGAIARKAEHAGAWVHVDGAFGLWGKLLEEHSALFEGIEQAHSFATDAHKWLNTPYDCGVVICHDARMLQQAMATVAPYFREDGAYAPKDMVPEFSRRARGVEVWAALRTMGREGVAEIIARCCANARRFANGLEELGFSILNDVVLNQLVATIGTPEELAAIRAHVEASGECWFGPTVWKGKHGIRISVSSWRTMEADIDRSLAAIAAAKQAVIGE
ncbi:pyridoxal phosphate-dependent decarboxylase family protein [Kordiimonas aestuarii]|uniref:pyridoxal phosphate-dependent decarboxylase family protein n=1 Tax=Kordiimonas aestuarii TaxID=1005925 RepID=UPI0021CF39C8|nr:pyridoxal-dependent decarboxylase [Kordiimonas aestuarii]